MKRLSWVSVADFLSAQRSIAAGADVLLVGDSLGMTVYGFLDTKSVTMEMMLAHTEAVCRAVNGKIPVVADMPIGTYETPGQALKNARQFLRVGAHSVKLEGAVFPQIEYLQKEGIGVVGHLGLLPQQAETFSVAGKTLEESMRIQRESKILEDLGVSEIILECVPESLGKAITDKLSIPVIGIGAGRFVDGQVLVYSDLTGRSDAYFRPKFLRRFGDVASEEERSISAFVKSVQDGLFPAEGEKY